MSIKPKPLIAILLATVTIFTSASLGFLSGKRIHERESYFKIQPSIYIPESGIRADNAADASELGALAALAAAGEQLSPSEMKKLRKAGVVHNTPQQLQPTKSGSVKLQESDFR